MMGMQPTLRERTRRAVQQQISDAAVGLFVERGYDATTIDEIAAQVGMSQRSVFRYFATKEDIVAGKFARGSDEILEILRARPTDEPVWISLRRMFDIVETAERQETTKPLQRVIFETPALLAVYLRNLHNLQNAVVAVLQERAQAATITGAHDDLTLRALTAAAFGCLVAAQLVSLESTTDDSIVSYIDDAMATITPNV